MNKTKIEWVKNPDGTQGYTWNPITGCLNHTDGMCKAGGFPCYAYRLANGRLKARYLANIEFRSLDPFYPRFWEYRLKEFEDRHTQNNRHPKSIGCFVCDMSDLFGIGVPEEWTRRVLDVISKQMIYPAQNDRFYILTKQPQNLIKFSPFPDNCWVGVTATNLDALHHGLHGLSWVTAGIKYISFEPLLERVFRSGRKPWIVDGGKSYLSDVDMLHLAGIRWLIIGAQTKPYKPPKIEWVKEIVAAADKAGVKVFLKDSLKPLLCSSVDGQELILQQNLWAFRYFKLRQEIPVWKK